MKVLKHVIVKSNDNDNELLKLKLPEDQLDDLNDFVESYDCHIVVSENDESVMGTVEVAVYTNEMGGDIVTTLLIDIPFEDYENLEQFVKGFGYSLAKTNEEKFTIFEIKQYLQGARLEGNHLENEMLQYAIDSLDDDENGIQAFLIRLKAQQG